MSIPLCRDMINEIMRELPDGSFLVRDSQLQALKDVKDAKEAAGTRASSGSGTVRDREYTLTLRFV